MTALSNYSSHCRRCSQWYHYQCRFCTVAEEQDDEATTGVITGAVPGCGCVPCVQEGHAAGCNPTEGALAVQRKPPMQSVVRRDTAPVTVDECRLHTGATIAVIDIGATRPRTGPLMLATIVLATIGCGQHSPMVQSSSLPAAIDLEQVEAPVLFTYEVVNAYPHDSSAFTQGLVYFDGFLYESTGLLGMSSLRRVQLDTGESEVLFNLPDFEFGEGLALCDERLIQLTWRSGTAHIYGIDDFVMAGAFTYEGEGWGLTCDGERLIMSDGTPVLQFRDTKTFALRRQLEVTSRGTPLDALNELEFINGLVYANVWKTDDIALIHPNDGRVVGWLDLSGLLATMRFAGHVDVLNGIAYDAAGDRLFVTGKLWPWLFEIRIIEKR